MLIVKIYDVVVYRSGRVPITFILQDPAGFEIKTLILPVNESTLIKSVAALSVFPFKTLTPVYDHVLVYDPHITDAEKGVIAKFQFAAPS